MKAINLIPAKQFIVEEKGHFGELYKLVYQGDSGVLVRQQCWTSSAWSHLRNELLCRRDDYRDIGPYNEVFLDIAFGGNLYSLGRSTKTLRINGKPVETGSAHYNTVLANMETIERSINFDAPAGYSRMRVFENIEIDSE